MTVAVAVAASGEDAIIDFLQRKDFLPQEDLASRASGHPADTWEVFCLGCSWFPSLTKVTDHKEGSQSKDNATVK